MLEQNVLKRRKSARIRVNWTACLQGSSAHTVKGEVTEVGDAGARFRCANGDLSRLSGNSALHLSLNTGSTEIALAGRAVWFHQNGESATCGIEFSDQEPSRRSRLQEFIFLDTGYIASLGGRLITDQERTNADHRRILSRIGRVFRDEIPQFVSALIDYEQQAGRRETYSQTLEQSLVETSERLLKILSEFEQTIDDKVLRKNLKRAFRNAVANWAYQSVLVRRGYEKPLGYPGDYRMLEFIYDNKPISTGFGLYWDQYFLKDPYAEAVRNRKDMMRDILRGLLRTATTRRRNILNLACGSCREVRELFATRAEAFSPHSTFTCIDQDEEAIAFANAELAKRSTSNSVLFIKENILNYVRYPERYREQLYGQDMVYSIGLADYLPDKILQKLTRFSYEVLGPGGQLVLAHKDCAAHDPLAPKWYCDWEFVPRDEAAFLRLLTDAGVSEPIKVVRERTGHIFFTVVRRQ